MFYCPEKYNKKIPNVNEELKQLKGTLNNREARVTLAKFLRHNLGFTTELISGIRLAPYQEITLKAWFNRNFNMCVWGRGCAKTSCYSTTYVIDRKKGLVLLKDLIPDVDFSTEDWVEISELELWNGHSWQKTNHIYVQKQKDCLELTTEKGYSLTGSTNHKIKCLESKNGKCEIVWKRYYELTEEDYVCVSRNQVDWNKTLDKEKIEDAYLVGLVVGDGCIAPSITWMDITSADESILSFCKSKGAKIRDTKSKAKRAIFSVSDTKNFLSRHGIKRSLSYDKVIPQSVMQSKDTLRAFIRGYFDTDGTVDKNVMRVCVTSVSEKLIQQLQVALLTFGIVSIKREDKTNSSFGKTYKLSITGKNAILFHNEISFGLDRKYNILKTHVDKQIKSNSNNDIVPGAKEFAHKVKSSKRLPKESSDKWRNKIRRKDNQKCLSYESLKRHIDFFDEAEFNSPDYNSLKEIQDENFLFDKIKSLNPLKADCLDFNVPDGECYWSNGFISHNSFMAAVFCFLYCIFNPGAKIIIAGPTFRTARNIFTELEKIVSSKGADLLAQIFTEEKKSKRNDLFSWTIGDSSIRAIPLNGEKIRGFRASVLICDEYLLLSEDIIDNVLTPFLVAPQDINRRLKIREAEDRLIAQGKMKEEDRAVFESQSKMIALSSASFTFENLYKTFLEWITNINSTDKTDSSYFVSQMGYEAIPKDMVEKTIIEEAMNGGSSNASFLREYCAQFTDGSDGYFSALKMSKCTIPDGEEPTLKLSGDKNKKYIFGIDPNFSNSPSADYFAIAVLELDEQKKHCFLVHNYANAGGDLKDHINYFYYLCMVFNPVLIFVDNAGSNFIDSANEAECFLKIKRNYKFIESWNSDKQDHEYLDMLKEAKKEYNQEIGRICVRQVFTGDFIRRANEHLQGAIDHKTLWFGSRITPIPETMERAMALNLPLRELKMESNIEAIDSQDEMIHQVKKQCALIEVKTTARGTQSFDLPQHLKRSTSPTRARKDNYTALMLGTWATKAYFDLKEFKEEVAPSTFAPILIPHFS